MPATHAETLRGHPELVTALCRPECYPHPVGRVRVLETHISWVLLTGAWAYKIKKPLDLGFLDFSTLELRRRFCDEELRLNRRLAPGIYDSVVEIRGTPARPRVGGGGPVLEYAVKMREFPQEALADGMLGRGELTPLHIDRLADAISRFHAGAAVAGKGTPYGTPEAVLGPALQNFEQILPRLDNEADRDALQSLRDWTLGAHAACSDAFNARRERGFVRECHGDLHLGNIAVIDGDPVAFDCIEFNDALRWIDVMSEVAFVLMDLNDRGRGDLGWRLLNRYLEQTGDYAGLRVLRFYVVYRALVRAKVDALRARQPDVDDGEKIRLAKALREYLRLAAAFTAPERPALIITRGVSGSGKTSATQPLIEIAGAVRVRSDIERKRLHGLGALAQSGSGLGAGIYTPGATAATYDRLLLLSRTIIDAGFTALADATFLECAERDRFRALAAELRAPFLILDLHAPLPLLRERVVTRRHGASDASEADLAVLERQLASCEALAPDEAAHAVAIDTVDPAADTSKPVMERLRQARQRAERA